MFVQATKSKRGDKVYTSYLIRESFRTAQGPRSRTICNISALPESLRELITDSLSGKKFVATQDLELSDALDYGGLAVLDQAWQSFGLEGLFDQVSSVRHRQLLKAMVFGRILFPCSKLSLADHARGSLLAACCGLDQQSEHFDEDELYEAMDGLNAQWVGIEKKLFNQAFKDQSLTLVLYDLSSVYFEGKGPRGLARYGYSRDHRPDRTQVLLAVATDANGVPVHLEVLKGNRSDNTTLHGLLETLRRRFGIREAVFVFDGGMSSKLNLERMQAQDLHFITRISSSSLQSLVAQLPLDTQPQLWDRTELIELQVQERRYLIAGGSLRQYRDKERRQSRIKKALEALQKMASVPRKKVDAQKLASQAGRKLQSLKAHQYFRYWVDAQGQLRYEKNDSLIDSEQALDGLYLLLTSLEAAQCPGVKVLERYKNLQRVEEAFCQLKNYLELRPVFHWRADRVRNHLRLCFIAYWIVARLGFQWSQKGLKTEGVTLLRQLQQIRVGRLKIPKHQSSCLLTKVPPLLNALLHQLGLLQLFSHPPSWARL